LQFSSLGSGSKGNGTLVRYGDCTLLVDCGFTLKETEKRLASLGVSPQEIDGIIVTHEHGDHINGVGPFARRHKTTVYMTQGTYRARDIGQIPNIELIKHYAQFTLKGITICPIAVPHDAQEPAQYVFEAGTKRLGLLTDLGSITPHIESRYSAWQAKLDHITLPEQHVIYASQNEGFDWIDLLKAS